MNYYPEPDSHIRDKVKVVFELSYYVTKKELYHVTRVDTSDLAANKTFYCFGNWSWQTSINKLVNVSTSLNNLKTKVDDSDADKLKTVPVDFNN